MSAIREGSLTAHVIDGVQAIVSRLRRRMRTATTEGAFAEEMSNHLFLIDGATDDEACILLERRRADFARGRINPDLKLANGYYLLHELIDCQLPRATEKLLALGANPNLRNEFGSSSLQIAIAEGWGDIVDVLLAAGANVHAEPEPAADLSAIAVAVVHGQAHLLARLVAAGGNVNETTPGGASLLHIAVSSPEADVRSVIELLRLGADPGILNTNSQRPIHIATGAARAALLAHEAEQAMSQAVCASRPERASRSMGL